MYTIRFLSKKKEKKTKMKGLMCNFDRKYNVLTVLFSMEVKIHVRSMLVYVICKVKQHSTESIRIKRAKCGFVI